MAFVMPHRAIANWQTFSHLFVITALWQPLADFWRAILNAF
jgi:hypothetical protein